VQTLSIAFTEIDIRNIGEHFMRLNWKVIIGGGVLMYIVQFVVSMITGAFIHEGVLEPYYMATTEFWRPELVQDPPDMAAIMPYWVTTGLIMSLVFAGIYDNLREALTGSGVLQGLKYGLLLAILWSLFGMGYSGVFNLPLAIWAWWAIDGFIFFPIGGMVLGWFTAKFGD
jgi:hypothetical protein